MIIHEARSLNRLHFTGMHIVPNTSLSSARARSFNFVRKPGTACVTPPERVGPGACGLLSLCLQSPNSPVPCTGMPTPLSTPQFRAHPPWLPPCVPMLVSRPRSGWAQSIFVVEGIALMGAVVELGLGDDGPRVSYRTEKDARGGGSGDCTREHGQPVHNGDRMSAGSRNQGDGREVGSSPTGIRRGQTHAETRKPMKVESGSGAC